MNFYVIKDSDENTEFVTLLKEDALLIDEVNEYGVGHVNMYPSNGNGGLGKAHNHNVYGGRHIIVVLIVILQINQIVNLIMKTVK